MPEAIKTEHPHIVRLEGVCGGEPVIDGLRVTVVATPLTLVFEFLDTKGTVVGNQEVLIPALKPGQSHPIEVKAQGAGITAWRYKQK